MKARLPLFVMRGFRKDARGGTVVEFALVLPILCVLLFCLLEFGYQLYVNSVMQGALFDAGRLATVGDKTGAEIDAYVRKRIETLLADASITITKRSYYDFTGIGKPEEIVADTDPVGTYNQGDCFKDANGSGSYDQDQGQDGLGSADDVVNYEIAATYRRILPLTALMGLPPMVTIKTSTPLRNQPFAKRSTIPAPVLCL